MARKRKEASFIETLATGGIILIGCLIYQWGVSFCLTVLLTGLSALGVLIWIGKSLVSKNKEKQRSLMTPKKRALDEKMEALGITSSTEKEKYIEALKIIKRHAKELAMRKRQLLIPGTYGVIDDRQWLDEIELFIEKVIKPATGGFDLEDNNKKKRPSPIKATIHEMVSNVILESDFSEDLTPTEYELFVADTLEKAGWDSRTTKASGDQGVDVIASKNGVVIVIQCKLYSKPVGNYAVQEAISGREFENADYAVVVSNSTYTKSASQLAGTANVLLLHHDELSDLNTKLEVLSKKLKLV